MVEIIPEVSSIRYKSQIVHPIFYKCLEYINDPFWKDVFENLSMGKYPNCIYISKNNIYGTNKKKPFIYNIPSENCDPKLIYEELKNILMTNTSLCSNQDTKTSKQKQKEKKQDTTWSGIKKKNEKDVYLVNYVLKQKEIHNLDWIKTRELYSLIKSSYITTKDIIFNNNQIQSIKGIVYNPETGTFTNNTNMKTDSTADEENSNKKYLFYFWDVYVSSTLRK